MTLQNSLWVVHILKQQISFNYLIMAVMMMMIMTVICSTAYIEMLVWTMWEHQTDEQIQISSWQML
jgi:hypothetical protein